VGDDVFLEDPTVKSRIFKGYYYLYILNRGGAYIFRTGGKVCGNDWNGSSSVCAQWNHEQLDSRCKLLCIAPCSKFIIIKMNPLLIYNFSSCSLREKRL
jgi:hypothetical protein